MNFLWSKLKRSLPVLAAGALVLSAAAQESGQAIIFSSPQSDDAQVVTPSLTPHDSQLPIQPNVLVPMSPLAPGSDVSGNQMPAPMPSASQQRLKQSQEDRRDWTMMTPAEILGVATVDKMLQPSERDAFGREKKTTPQERYLDRESQSRTSLTNGWRSDRANSPWNVSRDQDKDTASAFTDRRLDGVADPMQNLKRFLDGQQNRIAPANQNVKFDENTFDAITKKKESQEKLEQLATMERFRQLLQPRVEASPDSQFFPAPKPVVNPNFTVPEFVPNPAGASFTPLSSSIGRPAGLTPLPSAFTTHPQPAVIPSWKPQPPPWVSQSGLPTAFPQQKY